MASKRYNWKIGDIITRNWRDGNISHCLILNYTYDIYFESYTIHVLETGETLNITPSVDRPHTWRKIA